MKIPFKQGNEVHLIDIDDIQYLDIYKKTISVYTANETYQTLCTLSDWHSFLNQYGFDTISQSAIVNMSKIETFDRELSTVLFENGNSTGVSRANVKKIRNYIKSKTPSK